jgi:hypothetical protein
MSTVIPFRPRPKRFGRTVLEIARYVYERMILPCSPDNAFMYGLKPDEVIDTFPESSVEERRRGITIAVQLADADLAAARPEGGPQ